MKYSHPDGPPTRFMRIVCTVVETFYRSERFKKNTTAALDDVACYCVHLAPLASRRFARAVLSHFTEHDN